MNNEPTTMTLPEKLHVIMETINYHKEQIQHRNRQLIIHGNMDELPQITYHVKQLHDAIHLAFKNIINQQTN